MRNAKVTKCLRKLKEAQLQLSHVIDVGVQHGTSPLMKVFPDLHHALFEPIEEDYPHIHRNYETLSFELAEAAVSDTNGQMLLRTEKKIRSDKVSQSYLPDRLSADTRSVKRVRLDSFFACHSNMNRYRLKAEVQGPGVPAAILRGAPGMFDKIVVLMIETTVDRFMERAIVLREVGFDLWESADLCYYVDGLRQVDAFFIRRYLKSAIPSLCHMTAGPFRKDLWQGGFS